jgi:hypothetical protein
VKVESVDTATTRRLSIPRLEMSEGKADAVTSITALLDRAVVWALGGKIASMYCAVYLVPDLTGSGPISATGLPPGARTPAAPMVNSHTWSRASMTVSPGPLAASAAARLG